VKTLPAASHIIQKIEEPTNSNIQAHHLIPASGGV